MAKINLAKIIKNLQRIISKHSPEILTGLGITGMVTTTVLAVKATPKALVRIEKRKYELETDKLTTIETIQATWDCYIPAVASAVISSSCLIGANSVNTRRNAALATAYKLSEAALSEYKDAVIETIGEKKERTIKDKISENSVKENPASSSEIVITRKGETLCYDPVFKQYFKSDIDAIERAVIKLNKKMLKDPFDCGISVNDLYYELNIPEIPIVGDEHGWNLSNDLQVSFSAQIADDEATPCIVMNYTNRPKYGYNSY